jgi:hypothetical protein
MAWPWPDLRKTENRTKMTHKFNFLLFVILASWGYGEGLPKLANDNLDKASMAEVLPRLTKMAGTTPAQWRVVWHGDPATQAGIAWSTAQPGKVHKLYYDTEAHGLEVSKYKHTAMAHRSGKYRNDEKSKEDEGILDQVAHCHHVKLEGLEPGSDYHFVIESDGEFSKPLYFRTAPAGDEPFSILNGGDSRSGLVNRCRINLRMAKMVEDNPKILALAHAGDYVNKGNTWHDWRLWLSHNELLTCKDGRVIPIIPTRGNHERAEQSGMYDDVFDVPEWHHTKLPLGLDLITLSSNNPGRGGQLDWLKATNDKVGPVSHWLLTMYHAPIYPGVKDTPACKDDWAKEFDRYYTDIAFEGDGHCIKKSKFIRADKEDKDGVVYLGEGGLGVGQREPKEERWWIGRAGRGTFVFLLDVTKETLRCRTVLLDGTVWDDLTIPNKAHLRKKKG